VQRWKVKLAVRRTVLEHAFDTTNEIRDDRRLYSVDQVRSFLARLFVAMRFTRRQPSSRCLCERDLPLVSMIQCRPEGVWWLV